MLERSLDLIGAEFTAPAAGGQQKTAAQALLEERRRTKRATEINESFSFVPSKKPSPTGGTPLFEQISTSSVEAPKYWSGGKKRQPKVVKASQSAKNSRGKVKGENYNDRFNEKLASKAAKSKLKSKAKSS